MYVLFYLLFHPRYYYYGFIHVSYIIRNDDISMHSNTKPSYFDFFTGCMWSMCGVHDKGWAERPVFGKIRYMNFNGCKRKFDVEAFARKFSAAKRKIDSAEEGLPVKKMRKTKE